MLMDSTYDLRLKSEVGKFCIFKAIDPGLLMKCAQGFSGVFLLPDKVEREISSGIVSGENTVHHERKSSHQSGIIAQIGCNNPCIPSNTRNGINIQVAFNG